MRSINLHKTILLASFLLALSTASFAQDQNIRGAVKSRDGLLIVWNEPDNNFTLYVKSISIEPIPNRNLAFLFDDKFLQIVSAQKNDFLTDAQKKQSLDEAAVLSAHRDWESNYLSGELGEKLKIESEQIKLSNGKPALIWSFVPPKNSGTVKKQVFITVASRVAIVVLNGASTATVSEQAVRTFLLDTINTLHLTEKPLSQADAVKMASKKN